MDRKKSALIALGFTLLLAPACKNTTADDEWTSGEPNSRDTTVNGKQYRSYHGFYYPIYGGRIAPNSYQGATTSQLSDPNFTPRRVSGFGSTGRMRSNAGS